MAVPLFDTAAAAHENNTVFLQHHFAALLKEAFPHLEVSSHHNTHTVLTCSLRWRALLQRPFGVALTRGPAFNRLARSRRS